MNKQQEALRLALEALEKALRYHGVMLLSDPPQDAWKYHRVEQSSQEAITAIREVLAQPEPQTIHCKHRRENNGVCPHHNLHCGWPKCNEPERPAVQGEPVALGEEWTPCIKLPVIVHVRKQRPGESHVSTREGITPVRPDDLIMRGVAGEEYPIGRELWERTYTTDTTPQPAVPERKSWVGLTDDEINACDPQEECWNLLEVARAIEAKLREKNNVF